MNRGNASIASAWADAGDLDEAVLASPPKPARAAPRPHVCFVAMNIYPTLTGATNIAITGGAEVQQTILARALVADGFRVSVLTADHDADPGPCWSRRGNGP